MKNKIMMALGVLMIGNTAATADINQAAQKIEAVIDEDMEEKEQDITKNMEAIEEDEQKLEGDREAAEDVQDLEGAHVTLSLQDVPDQMPQDLVNLRETYTITPTATE